ncbi:hypothetical protein Hanom_Chr14g01265291 [Helianthus anomalus]
MDNETLRRLNVYQGQDSEPPYRKKFGAIAKPGYIPPANNKRRHDDSDSDDKKKRTSTPRTPKASTPKATPKRTPKKKSPLHLVDEPDEVQPENVNVAGGDNEIFFDEIENIIAAQDAEKAKNVEKVGVVRTDSSEIESDIDVTQMSPPIGHNGKRGRKTGPSRKRKNSDEEDASCEPSAAEAEKLKKGRGIMKCTAQPTGEIPRKLKARKTIAKAVKDTSGQPVQVSVERVESVEVEVLVVQAEVHVSTPPTSPI